MIKLVKLLLVGLGFSVVMGLSFAQEAGSVAEAKKLTETRCVQGCLVLSPQEIANIESNIKAAIQQAYEAGLRGWGKQS